MNISNNPTPALRCRAYTYRTTPPGTTSIAQPRSLLSDRITYKTLARTTVNVKDVGHVVLSLLTHFRLHYVAIVYDYDSLHRQLANELHIAMTDR